MHNLNQKGCFRHMEKFPMNNTIENNNLSTVKVQIFLALYNFFFKESAVAMKFLKKRRKFWSNIK